jgi:hypothetical protein
MPHGLAQRVVVPADRRPQSRGDRGRQGGATVTFGLDGGSYEIDLTAKNATGLCRVLWPKIEAGRRVQASGGRRVRTWVVAGTRTVKQSARANGYQARDRGRIPSAVMAAFEVAN